ncbi:GIN domain-containing protein [Chryseobacterium sp. GP-SGM7]|uniref:GIN domain-containing protein n=1 Tax=Chryseobacterium sp. GP-SGM7 TaxID=3411323 RepID=UPI003B92605F
MKDLVKAESENASNIRVKSIFNNKNQTFETETAGKIFADSKAENVYINLKNTGGFSGKIVAKNLKININSASNAKLRGSADNAEINADSASNLDAKNVNIKTAKVYATATSTVTLSVSEELTAEATSLAKIKYKTLSGIKFSAKRKSGGKINSI